MSTLLYLILAISVFCPDKLVALSVCEGDTLNIDCGSDVIHVLAANYGRTDGTTCPHSAMSNQACFATNSLSIVTTACEGISICSIAALNSIFGDPCHGTYKYLEVDYECVTPVEPVPEVVKVGCFNTNTDDEPIESLECRDDYLVSHHLERELHVEKCARQLQLEGGQLSHC
uniref:Rhamnose-binding lectin-like n=1 Tax=Saccoglossus kowalevskii TaxID=10224 RepID=A0ABM0LU99_SACKO|nr:PREDICTED: rhamnose-binding lectin-like [Saccoglossus kowalevskii]